MSTFRCWDTAGRLTGSVAASWPTAIGAAVIRAKIARQPAVIAVKAELDLVAIGMHADEALHKEGLTVGALGRRWSLVLASGLGDDLLGLVVEFLDLGRRDLLGDAAVVVIGLNTSAKKRKNEQQKHA